VLAAHCAHDGKGIGGEVKLPSAGEVHVHAKVASQFPLDRIEVLYNGKAVATAVPVKKELTTELDTTIPIKRSGWIAAPAVGPAVANAQGEWAACAHEPGPRSGRR
jgi:hypothetical protein